MDRTKRSSNNCGIVRSTSESLLKRTSSSVNVAVAKSDLYLKDMKTFGTTEDHNIAPFNENDTIEVNIVLSLLLLFNSFNSSLVRTW